VVKVLQLKRESPRGAVVRLIEEALPNGESQPGDRIVEAELAQQAGVGRGPMCKAIRYTEAGGATAVGQVIEADILTASTEVIEQVRDWSKE